MECISCAGGRQCSSRQLFWQRGKIHACIHTHTGVPTLMHTYMRMHTRMHACMHACIHARMPTSMHTLHRVYRQAHGVVYVCGDLRLKVILLSFWCRYWAVPLNWLPQKRMFVVCVCVCLFEMFVGRPRLCYHPCCHSFCANRHSGKYQLHVRIINGTGVSSNGASFLSMRAVFCMADIHYWMHADL